MAKSDDRWPFGSSDGGPESRPLIVDMEGVLVAICENDAAGEHALAALSELGIDAAHLRFYSSAQILRYEEEFRSDRTLTGRLIGGFVDDVDLFDASGCELHDPHSPYNVRLRALTGVERLEAYPPAVGEPTECPF